MHDAGFEEMVERYRDAMHAVVRGDGEPQKELWSRRDDVTLANPLGPPVRGWAAVDLALDRAASQLRDGEPVQFEVISQVATPNLGYVLWIERTTLRLGAEIELQPIALRVTTIFRNEEDAWRIVHRHADPITIARPIASVVMADG